MTASPRFYLVMALLLLAAYVLPWLSGTSASLTSGAFDLAEWSSLHPAVRDANPPLVAAFLLRLPLACIGLILAFSAPPMLTVGWWLRFSLIVAVAMALLPPLEFFTQFGGDTNYRQMFALSIFTLVMGAAGLSGMMGRFSPFIVTGLGLAGLLSGLVGITQAYTLMQNFRIPVQIGLGYFLSAGLFVVIVLRESGLLARNAGKSKQGSP